MRSHGLIAMVGLALALLTGVAQAMTWERIGADLYATGRVVDTDYVAIREALEAGGVQRLILVDSPGGDAWTGLQVAHVVRAARIDTLAAGECYSACALIFVAGKERTFADGRAAAETRVGIHGPHDPGTKLVNPTMAPKIYGLFKAQMGERFDDVLVKQALYGIEDADGMLFFPEVERNRPASQAPWFCSRGDMPTNRCQRHTGKDAHSVGLVTRRETTHVALPSAWRSTIAFFGRQLPGPEPDAVRAKALLRAEAWCAQAPCKSSAAELVETWMHGGRHRAQAVAMHSQREVVSVVSVPDAQGAWAVALHSCNFQAKRVRLCQVVALDDHDLEPYYAAGASQSAALLRDLGEPLASAVEDERLQPGMSSATSYQVPLAQQLTPGAVLGARRIDSAELVMLLKSPTPPLLIDVSDAGQAMLPNALHFVNGGRAYPDEAREAGYDRRFRAAMAEALPDKSAAVAIYGESAWSWQAVNASLRAVKAGYTQVLWYRGGTAAWQAGGLPTVGKLPVVVLR